MIMKKLIDKKNELGGELVVIENEKFKRTNFQILPLREPNILAHVRFNERTIQPKGAKQFDIDYDNWVKSGKKGEQPDFKKYGKEERILFIEEIQSDWAASNRKLNKLAEPDRIRETS